MLPKLNLALGVAIGAIMTGFIVIGLAWNGAAEHNCVDCQMPYLLSGGAVGLGLIIVGAGVILFEAGRRVTQSLEENMARLTDALQAAAGPSANGAASPDGKAASAAPSKDAVVLGGSSFHRQDCRLVEGKTGLTYGSLDEALVRELDPCRVCDPVGTIAKKTKRSSARR